MIALYYLVRLWFYPCENCPVTRGWESWILTLYIVMNLCLFGFGYHKLWTIPLLIGITILYIIATELYLNSLRKCRCTYNNNFMVFQQDLHVLLILETVLLAFCSILLFLTRSIK